MDGESVGQKRATHQQIMSVKGICLNPKDIPPDDLCDEILSSMIKEAVRFP